jgi:hypothetical protein
VGRCGGCNFKLFYFSYSFRDCIGILVLWVGRWFHVFFWGVAALLLVLMFFVSGIYISLYSRIGGWLAFLKYTPRGLYIR